MICGNIDLLMSCDRLSLDMRTYPPERRSPARSPCAMAPSTTTSFCFDPGRQDTITVIRAYYEWPWTTSVNQMTEKTNGNLILGAMAAFMNEPFGGAVSSKPTAEAGDEGQARLMRLLRDRSGTAAVEFAIILPVMLVLYLGAFQASHLIMTKRKVESAAEAVGGIVARSPRDEHDAPEERAPGLRRHRRRRRGGGSQGHDHHREDGRQRQGDRGLAARRHGGGRRLGHALPLPTI